eukprot:TRINITY_DN1217_c0_g1_i7.p1 TRINITY_DN1217_c0_g1~~TRINITY_DN1217_c0_g1_i7.p1  ORF type:complete len:421 (+),score=96.40 TRINITY_DN1217_c0_g1_i7:1175-2437(+)
MGIPIPRAMVPLRARPGDRLLKFIIQFEGRVEIILEEGTDPGRERTEEMLLAKAESLGVPLEVAMAGQIGIAGLGYMMVKQYFASLEGGSDGERRSRIVGCEVQKSETYREFEFPRTVQDFQITYACGCSAVQPVRFKGGVLKGTLETAWRVVKLQTRGCRHHPTPGKEGVVGIAAGAGATKVTLREFLERCDARIRAPVGKVKDLIKVKAWVRDGRKVTLDVYEGRGPCEKETRRTVQDHLRKMGVEEVDLQSAVVTVPGLFEDVSFERYLGLLARKKEEDRERRPEVVATDLPTLEELKWSKKDKKRARARSASTDSDCVEGGYIYLKGTGADGTVVEANICRGELKGMTGPQFKFLAEHRLMEELGGDNLVRDTVKVRNKENWAPVNSAVAWLQLESGRARVGPIPHKKRSKGSLAR